MAAGVSVLYGLQPIYHLLGGEILISKYSFHHIFHLLSGADHHEIFIDPEHLLAVNPL
jgi:hypothetical protein